MSKFKITNKRPGISPEDSKTYRDFEKIFDKTESHRKFTLLKNISISVLTAAFLITVAISIVPPFHSTNTNNQITPLSQKQETEPKYSDTSGVAPLSEIKTDSSKESPETEKLNENKSINSIETPENPKPKTTSDNTIEMSYTDARPVDGYPYLYQYFSESLQYPNESLKDSIQGSVLIRFTIDATGQVTNVSVKEPLHPKLDSVAYHVVQNMPKWIPATQNGKNVATTHSIPMIFEITNSNYHEDEND